MNTLTVPLLLCLHSVRGQHPWQTERLPPQLVYAGKTTIVRLDEYFRGLGHLNFFMYCLDNEEWNNGEEKSCPYWMDWDQQVPQLTVSPPTNLSEIEPVYSLRIVGRLKSNLKVDYYQRNSDQIQNHQGKKNGFLSYEDMIQGDTGDIKKEEDLVLVVMHHCFRKCPTHFGIGCQDWDIWLLFLGLFGMVFVLAGYCIREGCQILYEKSHQISSNRRRRVRKKGLPDEDQADGEQLRFESELGRQGILISSEGVNLQQRNFFDNSEDDEEMAERAREQFLRRQRRKSQNGDGSLWSSSLWNRVNDCWIGVSETMFHPCTSEGCLGSLFSSFSGGSSTSSSDDSRVRRKRGSRRRKRTK